MKWSGHLISGKNEPGKALVHSRNAHKTERNTVWSDSGCCTRTGESHGNASRRSAGPHSTNTIQLFGVCHSSQAWPKLLHPGKKWPTSTSTHAHTYLTGFAYIWLKALINKTYGCLMSNHWGNGPVNDLAPQSTAHGCWIIGTFQLFTQHVYKPLFHPQF